MGAKLNFLAKLNIFCLKKADFCLFFAYTLASSPFVRTKQKTELRAPFFVWYEQENMKGLEGGGVCGSKRFARRSNKIRKPESKLHQP